MKKVRERKQYTCIKCNAKFLGGGGSKYCYQCKAIWGKVSKLANKPEDTAKSVSVQSPTTGDYNQTLVLVPYN